MKVYKKIIKDCLDCPASERAFEKIKCAKKSWRPCPEYGIPAWCPLEDEKEPPSP